jgi:hypothetical protein
LTSTKKQNSIGQGKGSKISCTPEDDAITIQYKQEAFKAGLVHGFLAGAVATALVVKYGLFGIGKSPKSR